MVKRGSGAIINIASVLALLPEYVMEVDDLVDAALVSFDRLELVTIPPAPFAWDAFEQARGTLAQGLSNSMPAARYRA